MKLVLRAVDTEQQAIMRRDIEEELDAEEAAAFKELLKGRVRRSRAYDRSRSWFPWRIVIINIRRI